MYCLYHNYWIIRTVNCAQYHIVRFIGLTVCITLLADWPRPWLTVNEAPYISWLQLTYQFQTTNAWATPSFLVYRLLLKQRTRLHGLKLPSLLSLLTGFVLHSQEQDITHVVMDARLMLR